MSKSSPIYISDESEDEKEESSSDHTLVEVFSEDGNSMTGSLPCTPTKIKKETQETTPSKSPLNISPKIKITVGKDRLKWLSGIVKLASVSPVKTESATRDGASTTTSKDIKMEDIEDPLLQSSTSQSIPQDIENKDIKHHLQSSTSQSIPQDIENEDIKDHLQSSTSRRIPQGNENEENKDHLHYLKCKENESLSSSPWSQSPSSSKHLSDKQRVANRTPKKSNLEKSIESPRKAFLFGSPQKSLKQTCISEETFSPKKLMKSASDKIEDTSHHMPPVHACHFNGYVHNQKLERPIFPFTESQLIVLEGIKEEGLVAKYIDTLISFVSKYWKPPPEICFYLISEVLLKSETRSLVTKCFSALKRIQALHPSVPEQIEKTSLNWETIEMIVKRMELTGYACKKTQAFDDQCSVRSLSAFKALAFLINVMESEVPRKQFCLRRTIAFRLLSLQRTTSRNVKQLVWWLKECVAAFSHKKDNYLHQAIGLFQRLIQLSLSVSEDPESCAANLVGELLFAFNQLQHLECRTIFLQTLNSHLLRSKFLEKYLEIYCKDTEENRNLSHYSGIQKIVQVDFERLPPKRYFTENTSDSRRCHEWHRSREDCEEMSMVLSYSLQSYLFCHHKKLQSSPKRMPLSSDEEDGSHQKQANSHHLSIVDVDEICNMGDKVVVLAGRLMSLCHEGSLNARTNQLVELLSDMKLWDPW